MAKIKESRVSIRGPKIGYCNICETYGELTDDHIPSKGSAKIGAVEIRTLSEHFSSEKTYFCISQKGLLVRSICGICNNDRLGKQYDPYLNKISHEIKSLVKLHSEKRNILNMSITPQRVARAIVGQICLVKKIMPL